MVVSLLSLAYLLLGTGYLLAGIHAGRSNDAGVERGFAAFVGCLGLAAVFVSGAEVLRSTSIGTLWNGYLLAIAVYGTPTLYALAGVSWFAFVTRYVATVGVTFRQLVASLSIPVVLLIDGLRDPVLAVDRTGRVVDGNPPATRLFDASGTDLRGQSIETVLPDGAETAPLREPGTHELGFPDASRVEITVSPIADVADRSTTASSPMAALVRRPGCPDPNV